MSGSVKGEVKHRLLLCYATLRLSLSLSSLLAVIRRKREKKKKSWQTSKTSYFFYTFFSSPFTLLIKAVATIVRTLLFILFITKRGAFLAVCRIFLPMHFSHQKKEVLPFIRACSCQPACLALSTLMNSPHEIFKRNLFERRKGLHRMKERKPDMNSVSLLKNEGQNFSRSKKKNLEEKWANSLVKLSC